MSLMGLPPPDPIAKMMVFIDGENLVFRYKEMIKKGKVSTKLVKYEPEVYVWHPKTILSFNHEILRATYYTHVTGDRDKRVEEASTSLKKLEFQMDSRSKLPHYLFPCVLWKREKSRKAKVVDIQITVDILTHVHYNNIDTVFLVTGDGDYLPLLEEVRHSGKNVFLAAFSSGLNQSLIHKVDYFHDLDPIYFEK
jgi:uncharacterized LabA/DUF88 family protein